VTTTNLGEATAVGGASDASPTRSLVWRLLLIHGLITLATAAVAIAEPFGRWANFLLGGVITGHGALLGMWIAMKARSAAWWLLGTAAALLACAWPMKARSAAWWLLGTAAALLACAWHVRAALPGLGSETCAEVLLIEMVATCPLLLALRLFGVTLTDQAKPVADPRDRQFSLRSLFVWTAVVAILLSLFQIYPLTVMSSDSVNPLRSALQLVLVFFASALIGLAVMWAVLGKGRSGLRVSLLLGLVVFPSLVVLPTVVWWHRWLFFACHVGVMTLSLGAFRWAGYRLLWLGRGHAAAAEA
jgi:hypothetical protein